MSLAIEAASAMCRNRSAHLSLGSAVLSGLAAVAVAGCSTSGVPNLTAGLPDPAAQVAAPNPAPPSVEATAPAATSAASSLIPDLPDLPDLQGSFAKLAKGAAVPVGSSTEVYTRVARGALNCWFGATGPLKGPYIYHADAEPPSKGGRAEIVIRKRDTSAADPRSLRAYKVNIAPGGEGTKVEVENATIPEPLATRLASDVHRWAADQEGCSEAPVTAGWAAEPAAAPATDPKKGAKPAAAKASAKPAPAR